MQLNTCVCKSSTMTIWLQLKLVEVKTAQYFWSTSADMCYIQTEKNETFKDKDIYKKHFLPCFSVSAPYSTLISKSQTDETAVLSSHLGFLQSQLDLLSFQWKYAFYVFVHHTDLQRQILAYIMTSESITELLLHFKVVFLLHCLQSQFILEALFRENTCFLHRKAPCVES